jgi:hypothetical protein
MHKHKLVLSTHHPHALRHHVVRCERFGSARWKRQPAALHGGYKFMMPRSLARAKGGVDWLLAVLCTLVATSKDDEERGTDPRRTG